MWGPEQQQAFTEMNALMSTDAMLVYPDHNIPFDIESNASNYQLGAIIKQRGRPIAYDAPYFLFDVTWCSDYNPHGSQKSYSQTVPVYNAACYALAIIT